MKKIEKIQFYKQQIATAQDMQAISMQNYSLAARLEDSAKSALKELGAPDEPGRKAKHQLTEKERLSLIAGLTHGRKN